MTRRKLKILEFQNTKTETFKIHMKKSTYLISMLMKILDKKIENPKMTRRKLKTLELQNTKTKDVRSF
jgi:hypothetical protein